MTAPRLAAPNRFNGVISSHNSFLETEYPQCCRIADWRTGWATMLPMLYTKRAMDRSTALSKIF